MKNNRLILNGFLNCILFEFVKPELYVEIKYKDGNKKKEKLDVYPGLFEAVKKIDPRAE